MYSGQTWLAPKYDKKIKYLDYMENGVRSRGVGFIKLEQRDGLCSIGIQINGLYRRDRFTRPLLILDGEGERELCRLQLADGGVKIRMEKLDCRNLDGNGLRYEQMIGLRIPIMEGKEIRCLWGEPGERADTVETAAAEPDTAERGAGETEEAAAAEHDTAERGTGETGETAAAEHNAAERGAEETEETEETEEAAAAESPQMREPAAEPVIPPIVHEDKWTQLWVIYPHLKPFHDAREYLSMGPGDFVILPGRYYRLVNNSFLLHGYYNYHHLIMTRVGQRNDIKYYIGVPGSYYEKEKKIAVMFGFESFECAAEPAQEGDFGYYMIQVEL